MTSPQRNLRGELESWRDDPARSWVAKPGDVLVGVLETYREGRGAYGPAWIAQVREEDSGELRACWLFHAVLLDEFKRLRPKPGERVGIRRLEDGGKAGARYHRFAVVVDRPREGGELPDFEAFGPAMDAGAVPEAAPAATAKQRGNSGEVPNPFD